MPGRILIVDDVATNRIVMKVKLASACYEVLQAGSGAEALEMARQQQPDVILLDVMMPDMDGVDLCTTLKNDPHTRDIPVVMVTAVDDAQAKLRALRAGADEFLSKPINEMALLARVRSLLRARDTAEELRLRESTSQDLGFAEAATPFAPPANIVLIGRDEKTAVRWKSMLSGKCAGTFSVSSRANALALAETEPAPDIFVLESGAGLPDDGLHLISELRSRASTRHAAIVVVLPAVSGQGTTSAIGAVTALDLGANDILTDGFDPEELALRLTTQIRRKQKADRLRETLRRGLQMAVTDPLTGLYNRRYAMPHLDRIAQHAHKSNKPFALMLLDLDRFKTVNDTYGHSAGDAVLTEVAQRLRDHLRGVDMVARIGGEEFLVVMPDTDLKKAKQAAERLCRLVNDTPVTLRPGKQNLSVSLSIGVAMGGGPDGAVHSVQEVLERADRALYAAKAHGRNQVNVSLSAA